MAVSLSDSPPSQGPSCPVCFRDYGDSESNLIPRILQCGHTYCSECLDRLLNTPPDEDEYQQVVLNIRYGGQQWTTTRNYPRPPQLTSELKCPTCKAVNHIQNRDVSRLTKNFALLGCRSQMVGPGGVGNRNRHFCKDHDHEKRIYCNDCKTLICAYCQLYGGHKGHDFIVATEASKPSVESLRAAEKGLSEELGNLTTGVNALNKTISKLARTRNKCEKSVRRYFGGAIARLESQQDSLLAQISSWTEEQMYILNAQLDMLSSSMKELKTIQANCQSLVAGDPLDALTQQQGVEEEVRGLRERIRDVSLQPLINPWMRAKEEGPYDDTLNALVGNFKLTYDADTHVGGDNSGRLEEDEGGEGASGGGGGGDGGVGGASLSRPPPDDPSGNESDSSGDSLMGAGGSVGLSNVLEVYRLRSLKNRRRMLRGGAHSNAEDDLDNLGGGSDNEAGGSGRSKVSKVYSQETANFAPGTDPGSAGGSAAAIGLQDTEHPPSGHELNWLSNPPSTSSSFSPFTHHQRLQSNPPLLLDDSGSNSDPGSDAVALPGPSTTSASSLTRPRPRHMPSYLHFHLPGSLHSRSRRRVRGHHLHQRLSGENSEHEPSHMSMDLSTDEEEEEDSERDDELEEIIQQHQANELALSSPMATGVESVLDSLEIRRHWNFLNGSGAGAGVGLIRQRVSGSGSGGVGGGGRMMGDHRPGDSSKEEDEEEEDVIDPCYHTMVSYHTDGRSAHSDTSSPPPHSHAPSASAGGRGAASNSSDFAFPHHLSLPVGSGRSPDDEVVFPTTPHYTWTDQLGGRGRALQLNVGASGLVQLSLQPDASDREGMNSGPEDSGAADSPEP